MKQASFRPVVGGWLSFFLLAGLLRCATTPSTAPRPTAEATAPNDLAAPLAVALDSADPEHKAVLVAGTDLSAAARAAAALSGRSLIDPGAVPQTEAATLPVGYLRIDSVTGTSDEVRIRLWKGPIPAAKPGVLLLDCGTGLSFQLKRASDGAWTISSRGITVC